MNFRITFSKFLIALGTFIHSLPVVIMKPDHLVEFTRQTYSKSNFIESWCEESLVDSGLAEDELVLLSYLPKNEGELLLLGVGGGRDAIPLAKMGFRVTGVDFIPALVKKAQENANKQGINIRGMVQEFSNINVPNNSYDIAWLSRSMYSFIPTRARRIKMVQRIAQSLKPGGYFICQYHQGAHIQHSNTHRFLRKAIAFLTWGNTEYQEGDILLNNIEFLHPFSSEDEVKSELVEGGLEIIASHTKLKTNRCGVVCRKEFFNQDHVL